MDYIQPAKKSDDSVIWTYIKPTGKANAIVPNIFREAIALHIIKNQLSTLNTALVLAIQGPKGEGKTYQTREVCSQMGTYIVPVSGALLSGSLEKAAVEVLEKVYVFAATLRKETSAPTVLLIDDFDLSVASAFDDRRYTVNTQLLTGFLMNLADNPEHCGQKKTLRIPIIVTGNNFESLHSPLTRHGRMNFFEWFPTAEQKFQVVSSLYSQIEDLQSLRAFVEDYKDQPISFFAMLMDDLVNETILDTIHKEGRTFLPSIERAVSKTIESPMKISQLYALAARRQENMNPQDYVTTGVRRNGN